MFGALPLTCTRLQALLIITGEAGWEMRTCRAYFESRMEMIHAEAAMRREAM